MGRAVVVPGRGRIVGVAMELVPMASIIEVPPRNVAVFIVTASIHLVPLLEALLHDLAQMLLLLPLRGPI